MMEQVVMNLVVNARDAMPAGGALEITTEGLRLSERQLPAKGKSQPGEFVRLTVKDTGCGIPPSILTRIFDPFFTTKAVGQGTGLGLSTVYGIVEQHQGWLDVRSKVGEGTSFEIFFPAIHGFVAYDEGNANGSETRVRGGHERILLVEDEEPVRLFAAQLLRKMGYHVLEADCGKTALKLWKENAKSIDLLLTDIMMPDLTGWELARSLYFQKPGLRMVFMSGYSPESFEKDNSFLKDDEVYFLEKPCSSQALLQAVRRCLDKKALQHA